MTAQSPICPRPISSNEAPYVFVSYAHADRQIVRPYVSKLEERGLEIWWDERVASGGEWVQAIADAIADCSVFLLLVTRGVVDSEFCFREILFAQEERIRTVVSFLESVRLSNRLRFLLSPIHSIVDGDDHDRLVETLRRAAAEVELLRLRSSAGTAALDRDSKRRPSRRSASVDRGAGVAIQN